jgi:hypothetical protein
VKYKWRYAVYNFFETSGISLHKGSDARAAFEYIQKEWEKKAGAQRGATPGLVETLTKAQKAAKQAVG